MRYILTDTVGTLAGTSNLYDPGSTNVTTLTSTGAQGLVHNLRHADSFSVVFLGTNGGTAGTGTVTAQLQCSNDNINWVNVGTAGTLTIGTALGMTLDRPAYHFIRPSFAGLSAGTVLITNQIVIKADIYS